MSKRNIPLAVQHALSRDMAVTVAIALADAGGLPALSMRKLAEALGVQPMSLYHHVRSKEDLLNGMVDAVFAGMKLHCATGTGPLRQRAEDTRAVLIHHPWVNELIDTRTMPGRATLAYYNDVIGELRRDGASLTMIGHAMSLVDSYVRGFANRETSRLFTIPRHAAQAEFEFGLQLILNGLLDAAALSETERSAPTP